MQTNVDFPTPRPPQETPPFDWGSPPRVQSGLAAYLAAPIPQKSPLSAHNLAALLNGAEGAISAQDKLEQFFEECFHVNTQKKIPFGQRRGMWSYYEVFVACENILTKYHFISVRHPKVVAVIKETLSGLTQTLDDLKDRFEEDEHYFKRDFPKLFHCSTVEPSMGSRLDRIAKDLTEEREKIGAVLNGYNPVFLALIQAKKDLENPQCMRVRFPSLCGSGAIFLTKPFQDDWVALEQFYFDYFEMLNMHELYLHRFCQAIQRGRDIFLEGLFPQESFS